MRQSALATLVAERAPSRSLSGPGGASNAIDLKRLQGLARGNHEFLVPKGMSGL